MKRLKIGVIGCGVMGRFHLKQYAAIPGIEISGTSDIDPSRETSGIKFFKDFMDLIKVSDALSITTPTNTHYDIAAAALDAGCHALIEKPIAIRTEQAETLISKAKAMKLVLAVGHIERFNPAYAALIKALKAKKPDVIDIKRISPFPERITDVSCVMDMMIHDIDLARKIAGSNVKNINARGQKVRTKRLDKALAVIVFENGVVANIEADRVADKKERRLLVARGNDVYEADLLNKKLQIRRAGGAKEINVVNYDQLNCELRDFMGAIVKRKKPQVSGEDGLAALMIAEKIEEIAAKQC